ncbi:MAG: tetratricopeptide repeat protein [Bdellovibrionales bacterium]|nr:tetratricopeptide repeat protein [Bdellovibrionales bacterium]
MKQVLKYLAVLGFLTQSGCATFLEDLTSKDEGSEREMGGVFGNQADRAPASFDPKVSGGGTDQIDPTHLRTQADYHFTLGETYALAGEPDRAIEEFNLVLVYDPKSYLVHLKLAGEYIKKGKITDAIEMSRRAVELEPKNVESRILLGGLYAAIKLYDKAIEQYEAVLAEDPKNVETSLYLGAIYSEKGELKKALAVFSKLGKTSKESRHLAEYYSGRLFQQEKNHKTAIKHFQASLTSKPDFEDAVLAESESLELLKEHKKSIDLLEKFQIKHGPSEKVAQDLSRAYIEQEKYDKALDQFEIIVSHDPSNINVRIRMAWIMILQKDYDAAEKQLKAVLTQAPDSDRVRLYLGSIYEETDRPNDAVDQFLKIPVQSSYYSEARIHAAYLRRIQGKFKEASEIVKEALEHRNDVPQIYAMYASILDEMKSYNQAINLLGKAIEKFPRDEQLNFILGSLYDKVGKKDKTVETMKFVIEINAEHVQALNYLAYTYAEMGKELDSAKELAQRAIKLKPDDGFIQDTLGWVYFKRGEVKEAIKILEIASQLKPDEAIIAEHLGDAYYNHSLVDKAVKMYRKAAKLEKDNSVLQKLKSKIDAIEKDSGRKTASQADAN